MNQHQIVAYCDELLKISTVKDFCPNGLRVEGDNRTVAKVALGVSISLELIEKAIGIGADLILTHHGMIWDKDSRRITGPFRSKLQKLFQSGVAAAAYHLPLDFHPKLGNNVQLANVLELTAIEPIMSVPNQVEAVMGTTAHRTIGDFAAFIEQKLERKPLVLPFGNGPISRVVIITGGAQGYYMTAVERGANCFLTGEVSEKNFAMSQEYQLHFISAGHYATEKYGIQALGEHLRQELGVPCEFIEIDNPL